MKVNCACHSAHFSHWKLKGAESLISAKTDHEIWVFFQCESLCIMNYFIDLSFTFCCWGIQNPFFMYNNDRNFLFFRQYILYLYISNKCCVQLSKRIRALAYRTMRTCSVDERVLSTNRSTDVMEKKNTGGKINLLMDFSEFYIFVLLTKYQIFRIGFQAIFKEMSW